ncbi:MAG: FliG C-terminal domain-containing protein [Phycisphaerae bacterium]|nr:FliG C-terminal domain-containing protein [Phycisphaerae bacterium]
MKRLKRHVVRLRVRLAGLGAGARLTAALLAAVVLGGAVWLVWAVITPEPTTVIARNLDGEARERAAAALEREGIRVGRTEGGLTVSPQHLGDARNILRSDIPDGGSSGSGLRRLAGGLSMWRSSAENRRLWQAGVMAELGRLISEMDPIASASVFFEPGSPGGLGSKAQAARAAVTVRLAKGRRMSPGLIVAIGELISGSVAVEIGDVRVIDQTGRSYRPSSDAQSFAQRHTVEAYYSEKIVSALRYIPGMSADVQIIGARAGLKHASGGYRIAGDGLRVWVSIPKSYVSSAGSKESAAQQLASVKDAVRAILGPTGSHEVTVALHGPIIAKSGSDLMETHSGVGGGIVFAAIAGAVFVGALGAWVLLRWRRSVHPTPGGDGSTPDDEAHNELSYDMLAPFSDDGDDGRDEDLGREHPQTLALILVRMPSGQAAEIISRLPAELRAEVARRMGDLSDADAEIVAEINRDLARRLDGPSGGLSGQLAETENINRRRAERDALKLMAFEDITHLGAGELRVVLGAVEPDDLAISLRMAARQVRRKVLGCLSPKDAEYVRARMDRIGPMRICDVESARQRVIEIVSQAACGQAVEEAV